MSKKELMKELKKIKLRYSKKDHISEEDVRQACNADIREFIKDKYKLDINFKNEVATSNKTFIDSKYLNFIIEYKAPNVAIDNENRKQLLNYLNEGNKEINQGIITNGINIEFYQWSSSKNKFIELWSEEPDYSDEFSEDKFLYLCNLLGNPEKLVITENNINDYLGIDSNKKIIKKIYKYLSSSKNERTKLFYSEWQKLFNLSAEADETNEEKKKDIRRFYSELLELKIDNIEKEYKALFSVQTYYSIMLKLVLYKIIESEKNIKIDYHDIKSAFKKLEGNDFYREIGIVNLIDGDFFSWYLNEFNKEDFLYFYNKTQDITNVKLGETNLLFIKFYENIFPFWVRHSMGEYYTPGYLAEDVIENTLSYTKKQKNISLLDPTCGSGIFLLKGLKDKRVGNVYGVDINPLAVLTSKINYVINNFDLVNEERMEIPIYLGDSTYFPEVVSKNRIKCLKYELTTSIKDKQSIEFVFAFDIVKNFEFFEILDKLEMFVKQFDHKGAIRYMKSYKDFHYDELKENYDELINTLIDLEKRNLNSIWLKIIGNYLKTGVLRNIDCVVGNPPWVKWSNLPESYRALVKKNCKIDGIFSDDKNVGGIDLNICALIAFVTIRERLSKDGCLGFIMPDSILFNKSFEGFRKMRFGSEKFYLNKVIRWNNQSEKPFDPVSLTFAEYFFSFNKTTKTVVFDRKENAYKTAIQNPKSFNNHFIVASVSDAKKISSVLGCNELKFRAGISLPKGGHFLLEFKQKVDKNHCEYYVYKTNNKRMEVSKKTVVLENEIVYPYIKTEHINDNHILETNCYCIFPYPYGSKEPYSLADIRQMFPRFYRYFMSSDIQKSINTASSFNKRIQKTENDVGIIRVGDYTYSDCFLITRDNTKSSFAIVEKVKTPWGEKKMPLFDGHINYLSSGINGIDKKEINRLFNIFTQEGVKLYIANSADPRSISSRLYNDIKIK